MKALLTKKIATEKAMGGIKSAVESFVNWELEFNTRNVLNGTPEFVLDVDEDTFNRVKVGQHYQINIEPIGSEAFPTV